MFLHVLALLLLVSVLPGLDWTPPSDPNPQTILQEARVDVQAGRNDIALAKLVWIHEKSLSILPSFYGVRLSFSLGLWRELADKYPPAMEQLHAARDRAAGRIQASEPIREAFHDLASIDKHLGQSAETAKVFAELDAQRPTLADEVESIARPALVEAKCYALAAKYLKPQQQFERAVENFHLHREMAANGRFKDHMLEFARKSFTNEVATIIALLVVSGRTDEASGIDTLARKEWDDPSFHTALSEAISGKVPDPWP